MKNLLQLFKEFNNEKRLMSAKRTAILAVSGGIDSVVMCKLFHESQFPFVVAHCNFQLRGEESDSDEVFVKQLAEKYGAPFYSKRFETKAHAEKEHLSIQEAARKLRYEWFAQLRTEMIKDKRTRDVVIATAHQLNDNIETIIYNLIKGTGIRGLRGIPLRNNNVIRPLLFASREDIATYAQKQQLAYREDSSNSSDKYARNKIRHHVVPALKEINPSLEHTLADKVDLFTELENIYNRNIRRKAATIFFERKGATYISIAGLRNTTNASTILFEKLKDFGFNTTHIYDMMNTVDAEPGKRFQSNTHCIVKDRRFFILSEIASTGLTPQFVIDEKVAVPISDTASLLFEPLSAADAKVKPDPSMAFLDKSLIEYPLQVRYWKPGDYFYPFGMGMKKKKLKKFLTDIKVPSSEKDRVVVVESNRKIVWVAGFRIDERFKVSPKTAEVLCIRLKNS